MNILRGGRKAKNISVTLLVYSTDIRKHDRRDKWKVTSAMLLPLNSAENAHLWVIYLTDREYLRGRKLHEKETVRR